MHVTLRMIRTTATDQFGVLESVKAAADIHVPISGTLEEINTSLEDEPDLVNKEPYKRGVF